MSRAASSEAVEEANAAIGAAISTCSLSTDVESLLTDIQHDLLDLTEAVERGGPGPRTDRVEGALARYRVAPPPRGFAVLGGLSDGAGLLKLARTVTRRAARTVRTWGDATYLDLLAELLLALAVREEEAERGRIPFGLCIE